MKRFSLPQLLPIAIILFSLASCDIEEKTGTMHNTTLQASVDEADLRESGSSSLSYNTKTRTNVITYTDIVIDGEPIGGRSHDDDAIPWSLPDSIARTPASQLSFSLRPGLEYIGKGARFPGGNVNLNLNYLEIPIDVVAHYPAGPGSAHFGLGPYFAQGIGGGGPNGIYGENAGGFKRFDAGLNLLLGYQLDNGIALDLRYDLGLANVEYADEDVKGHTRTFSLNFGYQIGRLFTRKK